MKAAQIVPLRLLSSIAQQMLRDRDLHWSKPSFPWLFQAINSHIRNLNSNCDVVLELPKSADFLHAAFELDQSGPTILNLKEGPFTDVAASCAIVIRFGGLRKRPDIIKSAFGMLSSK